MSSPSELAALLRGQKQSLMVAWRQQVRRTDAGRSLDLTALNDHVPMLIDSVIVSLERAEKGAAQPEVVRGAPTHGATRLHDGYEMSDVVEELSMLRASAIELAESRGMPLQGATLRALNDAFDRVIADAVQAYSMAMNEAIQRQQSDHLAFVAHDLRTPLGAIALAVQALSRALPDGDVNTLVPRMIASLGRNVAHLTQMLDGVLDLSYATSAGAGGDTGGPRARLSTVKLWTLVDGLALGLQAQADAAGMRILVDVPPDLELQADEALLGRALQNLLVNAIEYASPGTVTVRAEQQGDWVCCRVQDSGKGIRPDRHDHVFDGGHSESRSTGHHGLGLSIARRFIEAQRGRIALESGAPGTTFRIDLPADAMPAGDPPALSAS